MMHKDSSRILQVLLKGKSKFQYDDLLLRKKQIKKEEKI